MTSHQLKSVSSTPKKTQTTKQVYDLLVVNQNFTSDGPGSLTLRHGDLVEVLDMNPNKQSGSDKNENTLTHECEHWADNEHVTNYLLNNPSAQHKISVRPRKNHISTVRRSKHLSNGLDMWSINNELANHVDTNRSNHTNLPILNTTTSIENDMNTQTHTDHNQMWLVRVFDSTETTKEGWVPSSILEVDSGQQQTEKAIYGDRVDDAAYRRQAVVRELIETEEEFGRDLNRVVENYIKTVENSKPPKIVSDNKDLIFGNFKQITEFHNTVLIEGVKYHADKPSMIGKTFLRLERDFDKHVIYCRDEPNAQEFLQERKDVREYFQDLSQKLGDEKDLSEHLQLPIQRINDYQLLLKRHRVNHLNVEDVEANISTF